ncbi:MAG: hypothetical protein H8E35_12075, partial [Ardenticatenia bacterium]|nr:hypothetical protein [Ardenticatenia bacterium]
MISETAPRIGLGEPLRSQRTAHAQQGQKAALSLQTRTAVAVAIVGVLVLAAVLGVVPVSGHKSPWSPIGAAGASAGTAQAVRGGAWGALVDV